jgi:hypothetical protein
LTKILTLSFSRITYHAHALRYTIMPYIYVHGNCWNMYKEKTTLEKLFKYIWRLPLQFDFPFEKNPSSSHKTTNSIQ